MRKGIYKHYKGNHYQVIDVARHTETEELLVVYRALNTSESKKDNLWVRPLKMFNEKVNFNGRNVSRFEFLEENTELPNN